ncbi:hypothetical protein [Halomicrococcus gelatinilyticus]|uniref:hypothetical protein n=1 Tax=Halomicrococcus gelatinilyticus TaxID=1702103 RepID=UPI002E0F2489
MDTLGDLVSRERRSDDPAVRVPGNTPREYDYRRFCTTTWKTGNYLRRLGVRSTDEVTERDEPLAGATVAVVPSRAPEPLLVLFGAALLGARVRFAPPLDVAARVLVAPGDEMDAYDLPPGSQRVAFDAESDDPAVAWFGESVWSENPSFPPTPVSPDAPAVTTGDADHAHADLLAAAESAATDWNLTVGDEVAVRAPLADPRAVAAGVLAPLLAGAAVLLPDDEAVGDAAVVEPGGDAPEAATLPVDDVSL